MYECIGVNADSLAFPGRWDAVDFHPFVANVLGGGGLCKASVLRKHTGWEGTWFGEQGALWHSSPPVSSATHKALSECAQQRPEAIKLLLGFLGTALPALSTDSQVLAAGLDNGGIQELPRWRVSEVKQWEEAKLQPWADRDPCVEAARGYNLG